MHPRAATLDGFAHVPADNDTALAQAVSQHPVAVAVCCGARRVISPACACMQGWFSAYAPSSFLSRSKVLQARCGGCMPKEAVVRAGDLIDAWHAYTGGMFDVPGARDAPYSLLAMESASCAAACCSASAAYRRMHAWALSRLSSPAVLLKGVCALPCMQRLPAAAATRSTMPWLLSASAPMTRAATSGW